MIPRNKFLILTIFTLLTTIACGQKVDVYSTKYQKEAKKELELAIKNGSAEVKQFHQKLSKAESAKESRSMIFALGKTGNKDFIPYLKALLKHGHCGRCIEVVLVQLGENSYFDKAISQIDVKLKPICLPSKKIDSEIYQRCYKFINRQDEAIWKLVRFKTKEAYKKIYQLLNDKSNRNFYKEDDFFVPTKSSHIIYQLCHAEENAPLNKKGTACSEDRQIWKWWFEANGYNP